MEDFNELCRLFREWRTRNREYESRAAQFARQFATEVARQIAAPNTFKLPGGDKEVPYVSPLKFNPKRNSFSALVGPTDTLVWDDDDGSWHAGIGIHLEPGGRGSFPKTEFTIQLRLQLHDWDCDLRIATKETFKIRVDDIASWNTAIEYTINTLVRTFKLQPWESYEERQKIGFIWQDKGGS